MTLFEIVALYVALNIILLVVLSYRVASVRRQHSIGIGDNGNTALQRAIRVQGNFTEYVPIALLGLLAMASLSASVYWLHGIGIALTLGRILHALGLGKSSGVSFGRLVGMILTWAVLLIQAGYLLYTILT